MRRYPRIPPSLFGDFLDKAIHEAPENVFVFSLCDPANAVMCVRHSYEELVTKGIVDVFISVSLDENALLNNDWSGNRKDKFKSLLENSCMIELYSEISEL